MASNNISTGPTTPAVSITKIVLVAEVVIRLNNVLIVKIVKIVLA